jgi:RimJ/RimL family protein N-acetyltransferase
VWARTLRYVGHWAWLKFGLWVVEEKSTSHFVGEVGYAIHKRDIKPALGNRPELGWVLAGRFHGKGYATEAVRAAMLWGAQQFRGQETVCIINAENLASIRVAQKCGFREFARTTYKTEPTILYVH